MRRILYRNSVDTLGSAGLLAVRLAVGAAFLFHGWPKIQHPFDWMGEKSPMPGLLQALAALAEFGGGLAWILGLLTPLAALGILCTMAVAVTTVHLPKGDPFVGPPGKPSFEPALVYFSIALLLLLAGPGRFSLDALLFGSSRGQPGGIGEPTVPGSVGPR